MLIEPDQEKQINCTAKLHSKNKSVDVIILIAVGRFRKWPTVKTCKTAETKEVMNFLTNIFIRIPQKNQVG